MRMTTWICCGVLAAWPTLAAHAAPTVFTDEHVDIGAAYVGGELELEAHDETNDQEYEPGDVLFYVSPAALTAQPAGSEWNFIGAGSGGNVWVLPQTQTPGLPFVGLAAEEVDPGTFASYLELDSRVASEGEWLKFSLLDVRGPGQFSVWTGSGFGTTVWMATSDGFDSSDAFFQLAGNHTDANFGFTATGIYEVDLQVSAYLGPGATNLISSELATYRFGVEMVPEPSTSALLALGGATWGLCLVRKRRSRRQL